ncbi:MAG: multidrug efflux SMR transporter [Rhodospirillaceae bacterium]|nr:multidrug efflux SMR transporter [Rhodospirillaceae bacterium]
MHWLYLALAIIFEVGGTTCMKLSEGLTKPIFAALIFVLYGVSFALLAIVLKKLDLGLTYAIWSGIGTATIALIGFIWFKEPMGPLKVGSIVLIIVGVVGLNLSRGAH